MRDEQVRTERKAPSRTGWHHRLFLSLCGVQAAEIEEAARLAQIKVGFASFVSTAHYSTISCTIGFLMSG